MPPCRNDRPPDAGSVSILVAALALVFVSVAAGATRVSVAAVARQQAQAAADAAALVAGRSGSPGEVAAANGATVVSVVRGPGWVEVEVDRRGARAVARATTGARELGTGANVAGLDPRVTRALARAEAILGRQVPVVSGLRSRADQEALYARRFSNPFPVAAPGTSMHELGLAIDVPIADAAAVAALGVGLCLPFPHADPVHLEWCGG